MPAPHPDSLGSAQVIGYVLADLAIILVATRLVGEICVRLGRPRIVGEILAGVLIGPTLLGGHLARAGISVLDRPAVAGEGLVNDLFPLQSFEFLNMVATLALVLFTFMLGLEVSRRYLRGQALHAAIVAIAIVAVPVGVGFLLASGLDTIGTWKAAATPEGRPVPFPTHALFIGAGLAMTAFPLVGRTLQRKRVLGTQMGRFAFSASLIAMPLAFAILATASISVRQQGALGSVPGKFLAAIALVAVLFGIARPLLRVLATRHERNDGTLHDGLLAALVAGMLGSALAADRIGVHAIVGAFAFGCCVPSVNGLGRRAIERLRGPTVVFGVPVIAAVVGLQTDFGVLDWGLLAGLLLFIVANVLCKVVSGAVAARAVGLRWREAGTLGLLTNFRGLMILAVSLVALQAGVIAPAMLVAFVTGAIVTTLMTGPLVDRLVPASTEDVRREGSIKRMLGTLPANAEGERVLVAPVVPPSMPGAFAAAHKRAAANSISQFLVADLPGLEEEGDYVGAGPGEVEAVTRAVRRQLEPGATGLREAGSEVALGCFQSPHPVADLVAVAEAWKADAAILGDEDEVHAFAGTGIAVEAVGSARR